MQIDPKTGALFTDDGKFLKTLSCPENKRWDELKPASDGTRACDTCSRKVHDTSLMTDSQLVSLVAQDPETCLSVSSSQANCTVIPLSSQNAPDGR